MEEDEENYSTSPTRRSGEQISELSHFTNISSMPNSWDQWSQISMDACNEPEGNKVYGTTTRRRSDGEIEEVKKSCVPLVETINTDEMMKEEKNPIPLVEVLKDKLVQLDQLNKFVFQNFN